MSLICVFVMQWAANLYVRIDAEFGRITVCLILAKATLWSYKKITIPPGFVKLAVIPNMQAMGCNKKIDFMLPLNWSVFILMLNLLLSTNTNCCRLMNWLSLFSTSLPEISTWIGFLCVRFVSLKTYMFFFCINYVRKWSKSAIFCSGCCIYQQGSWYLYPKSKLTSPTYLSTS